MKDEVRSQGSTERLRACQNDRPYTGDLPGELLEFRNFLVLAFDFLGFHSPTTNQLALAEWIQWGPKRIQAQAFRGIGKSLILELYCVWCLMVVYSSDNQPEYAVQNISASGARAYNFSAFCLGLIRNWPLVQHLAPGITQRSATDKFDVGTAPVQDSPSMSAFGVGGQAAGRRADLVCADDVETIANAATQLMRDKLLVQIKEIDAILRPLPPDPEHLFLRFPHLPRWLIQQVTNRVIVLGTPQTEMTIYATLTERGYAKRIWPSRFPSDKWMVANGAYLAPGLLERQQEDPSLRTGCGLDGQQGAPTDTRFSEADLIEREMSFGRTGYALQFQLDASLADADRYPLKLRDLVVMDLDGEVGPEKVIHAAGHSQVIRDLDSPGLAGDRFHEPLHLSGGFAPYTGSVMFIDPAGRGKDETAYAVVKMLNSQLFLVESHGFGPGVGYEEVILSKIALAAQRHKVNRVLVESNFGDGMFAALLKPTLRKIYPCMVEEVRTSVQKERRIIETLEPVMNQHRLIVAKSVVRGDVAVGAGLSDDQKVRYQLFHQMTRLSMEKGCLLHDDRLDALAGAVEYWVRAMGVDRDEAISDRKAEALDKALKDFLRANDNMGFLDTPRDEGPNWTHQNIRW